MSAKAAATIALGFCFAVCADVTNMASAEPVCSGDVHPSCVERASLQYFVVSLDVLRKNGILPQGLKKLKQLPISCDIVPNGWGVSISEEINSYYSKRGFDQKATCLALGGQGVFFDPTTGKQLPLYEVSGDISHQIRPARLPDCFKTVLTFSGAFNDFLKYWRPTGCRMLYHPTTGKKLSESDNVVLLSGGNVARGLDEDDKVSSLSEAGLRAIMQGRAVSQAPVSTSAK